MALVGFWTYLRTSYVTGVRMQMHAACIYARMLPPDRDLLHTGNIYAR